MTRKIPVLIDEDVYYHLQQLCVPSTQSLGDVVRDLLVKIENGNHGTGSDTKQALRRRDLLAELHDCRRRMASSHH